MEDTIRWEKSAEEKYKQMLAKIPVFLRPMAESTVGKNIKD